MYVPIGNRKFAGAAFPPENFDFRAALLAQFWSLRGNTRNRECKCSIEEIHGLTHAFQGRKYLQKESFQYAAAAKRGGRVNARPPCAAVRAHEGPTVRRPA